jgi:DNA-binding NtrC family response regulator
MATIENQQDNDLDEKQEELFSRLRTLPTLRRVTELLIEEALRRTEGNKSAAASLLGITRQALWQRLQRRGSRD